VSVIVRLVRAQTTKIRLSASDLGMLNAIGEKVESGKANVTGDIDAVIIFTEGANVLGTCGATVNGEYAEGNEVVGVAVSVVVGEPDGVRVILDAIGDNVGRAESNFGDCVDRRIGLGVGAIVLAPEGAIVTGFVVSRSSKPGGVGEISEKVGGSVDRAESGCCDCVDNRIGLVDGAKGAIDGVSVETGIRTFVGRREGY
jgi:hypothetical protein